MAIDISRFKTCRVLVVGDVGIDTFIWGNVERVAREAPVPLLSMHSETSSPGGAGNVAGNLASLGATVALVGLTGDDDDAKLTKDILDGLGVDTAGLQKDIKRRTVKKIRIIAAGQQILQMDRETVEPISAAMESSLISSIRKLLPQSDIVIVADRGQGTVTRSLMTEIMTLSKAGKKVCLVDPWDVSNDLYMGASILTLNVKDVERETGVRIYDKASLIKAGSAFLRQMRAEGLVVTCGKDGLVVFGRTGQPTHIESRPRDVYNATGARDTLVSVLALAIATGGSFRDSAMVANAAAGMVAGKVGTATVSEKELVLELMTLSGGPVSQAALFSDKPPRY